MYHRTSCSVLPIFDDYDKTMRYVQLRLRWLRAYIAFTYSTLRYLHANARGFANITLDYAAWKEAKELGL